MTDTTPRTLEQAFGPNSKLHIPRTSTMRRLSMFTVQCVGLLALTMLGLLLAMGIVVLVLSGLELIL